MAEITVTAPRCTVCGKASKLQVDEDAYKAWQKNTYIQDAFPTWSNEEREILISGTHPACWNKLFAEEEDE